MKNIITVCLVMLMGVALQAQKVVNDPNAEPRTVGSFTGLSVSNAFDVILTQGNEEGVAVSAADKDDVQYIKTEVKGNTLNIWFDNKEKSRWGKDKKLKAYVSVKTLEVLKASGATDINIEGQITANTLRLELSGASDVNGRIVLSGDLKAELSGASDVTINGSARNTDIEASGASSFKAYEFTTGSCNVEASGASGISITVDKEISAELSGASSVNYKGNASVKSVRTSGASSVSKKS